MRILADADEAAERLEELIELARRGDEVTLCRSGIPVAKLSAIPKRTGTLDDVWALAGAGRVNVTPGASSNHDDFYDENGLPK